MANQYPNIVPVGFSGDYNDFRNTVCDKSGAMRLIANAVTIPSATASGQVVGLFPFNAGASVGYGGKVYCDDLDTGTDVTVTLGYIYEDNTVGDDTDAFAAASTKPQSAGVVELDAKAGMTFKASANGWVVAVLGGGAPTTTSGDLTFNIPVAYDN